MGYGSGVIEYLAALLFKMALIYVILIVLSIYLTRLVESRLLRALVWVVLMCSPVVVTVQQWNVDAQVRAAEREAPRRDPSGALVTDVLCGIASHAEVGGETIVPPADAWFEDHRKGVVTTSAFVLRERGLRNYILPIVSKESPFGRVFVRVPSKGTASSHSTFVIDKSAAGAFQSGVVFKEYSGEEPSRQFVFRLEGDGAQGPAEFVLERDGNAVARYKVQIQRDNRHVSGRCEDHGTMMKAMIDQSLSAESLDDFPDE